MCVWGRGGITPFLFYEWGNPIDLKYLVMQVFFSNMDSIVIIEYALQGNLKDFLEHVFLDPSVKFIISYPVPIS